MREIWTGRIKPPVSGTEGIQLLKDYLNRNHDYRTGKLIYNKKMLYFGSILINQDKISQTDYNNFINQIASFMGVYESAGDVESVYNSDIEVQKTNYLNKLSQNHDFVFVNIHGSIEDQWLGGSTWVRGTEIKTSKPDALFSVLASCSNGDFTQDNYLAGWYLFSGNSLVVMANSVVAMLVNGDKIDFLKQYTPLGMGITFGEMSKNDGSFFPTQLLGDPTLTFREKPTTNIPSLVISTNSLEFGNINIGTKSSSKIISFKNEGTQTLKINFRSMPFSINGQPLNNLGYWDVFYYELNGIGTEKDFSTSIEIPAGQSKTIPFTFYPLTNSPSGKYSANMRFQTNDPENPYLSIKLTGNAI